MEAAKHEACGNALIPNYEDGIYRGLMCVACLVIVVGPRKRPGSQ